MIDVNDLGAFVSTTTNVAFLNHFKDLIEKRLVLLGSIPQPQEPQKTESSDQQKITESYEELEEFRDYDLDGHAQSEHVEIDIPDFTNG